MSSDRRDTSAFGGGGGQGTNVSARLQAELDRLATANPFEALGLGLDATPEQIRSSFLRLTKQYHPNRYARMERDVFKLANEVFLRVKAAYTRIADDASRQKTLETFRQKDRAPTATWRSPTTRRPTGTTRTARPAPRGTPSSRRVPRRATTNRPVPNPRTATFRGEHPSGAYDIAAELNNTVQRRNQDYEMALKMLSAGRYEDARTLLHKIAVEDPKTKKYRMQMHYAWGLEHEDNARFADARKEFERALAIDPEFKRAHEAIDRLPRDKKGSGFFGKIFGR